MKKNGAKAMKIIGGIHARRTLVVPEGVTRPTSGKLREALFNICQTRIEGARFLDLYAGSGAMGLEALSRGAAHATFVENDRAASDAIRKNLSTLKEEKRTRLLCCDVPKALEFLEGMQFDIIFADPPYGRGLAEQVLTLLDSCPLLAKDGIFFLEDTSETEVIELKTLKLKRSRRITGKTYLLEFFIEDCLST